MRWRWEGRDLPSLDERSSPSPPCPHPMLRVETRPWGGWGRSRGRLDECRWWRCPERGGGGGFGGLRRNGKKKENKIRQHDGFASTSLVHSPCLSLVGLWHSVDVLNTVGLPVGGATVSSALPLLDTYTDMMCLTKAGGTRKKFFRLFRKCRRRGAGEGKM